MTDYPHVARFRDRIEPDGRCDDLQARHVLSSLRVVLRLMASSARHPGLVRAHAIDSIGKYLDPAHAEERRSELMGENSEPISLVVTLRRRTYDIISVEQSELLDDRTRMMCTPIRGTSEVARRLETEDRALSEVVIKFVCGASLSLMQHSNAARAIVIATDRTGVHKGIEALLNDNHKICLARCFDGAGTGRLSVVRDEVLAAHAVTMRGGRQFHDLPVWMTEHLATIAQDVFRLHVLASGSSKNVSRMVQVDKTSVFRIDPTAVDTRVLIRSSLHATSGGCICALHRRKTTGKFRTIDFRIRICDEPLTKCLDGTCVCPRHNDQHIETHHKRCSNGLSFELWCCHEASTPGLRIPLPVPAQWMKTHLRDVASACCELTRAGEEVGENSNNLLDLKATVDNVMQTFDRERMVRGMTESILQPYDAAVVWLLRNDTASYASDNKFKGDHVGPEYNAMGESHGHLLKKMRL